MKILFCGGMVVNLCDFCEKQIGDPFEDPDFTGTPSADPIPNGAMCASCHRVFLLNVQAAGFTSPAEAPQWPKNNPSASDPFAPLISALSDKVEPLQATLTASRFREATHLLQLQTGIDLLTVILWEGRPDSPDQQQKFANRCCEFINAAHNSISTSPEGAGVRKLLAGESFQEKQAREAREAKRGRFKKAYDALQIQRNQNNPAGVLKNKRS